jgi:aminoglycoside phosphotransferase (APT) family kinase protein
LPLVAHLTPRWASRIDRLLAACNSLASTLPTPTLRGIHRDFYADHVLQDGNRLYLLDFDLFCMGDPALDVGNFAAHMQEWALRKTGDRHALATAEAALIDRYLQLSPLISQHSVQVYTLLTLVRHIYLSTQFPERRHITEALLDACESDLSRLSSHPSRSRRTLTRSRAEAIGVPYRQDHP